MLFSCSSILLTIWPLRQVGCEMVGHLLTNASPNLMFSTYQTIHRTTKINNMKEIGPAVYEEIADRKTNKQTE